MKTLLLALILAAVAYGGYRLFVADSAAYQTYQKFAEALARGRSEEALKYTDDEEIISDAGDAEHNMQAGYVPVEHIHGTNYQLESEEKMEDGKVRLKVKQVLYFDPPGTTSAIGGAMSAIFKQDVVMQKSSDGWKVVEFDSEFIEAKETRKQ
jgi:hypothetical protein